MVQQVKMNNVQLYCILIRRITVIHRVNLKLELSQVLTTQPANTNSVKNVQPKYTKSFFFKINSLLEVY